MRCLLVLIICCVLQDVHAVNEPDSVYLFAYATTKNNNKNGLHFAWSKDKKSWTSIGNEYSFLKSDYGSWGGEKRMISPFLFLDQQSTWHCIWSLNERENVFAHAASTDLINWKRQSYPRTSKGSNVIQPVISYANDKKAYMLTYKDGQGKYFGLTTTDFKTYNDALEMDASQQGNGRVQYTINGAVETGQQYHVAWKLVDNIIRTQELQVFKNNLYAESAKDDNTRFAGLQSFRATITLEEKAPKPISDMLIGVFFEDINYAADGGLYAELIQNRDFEYQLSDKKGRDTSWHAKHSWSVRGDNLNFTVETSSPLHVNNLHYAVITTKQVGASFINGGYDGIAVKKGETYQLSSWIKLIDGSKGKITVRLVNKKGDVLAQSSLTIGSKQWKNIHASLVSNADATDASLEIIPQQVGSLALDMVSLFPQKTYKNRTNGLRADLVNAIADLHPRFVRFPGGCVAHGDGLDNIYKWKNTIGPIEARKPQRNIWNYHQSVGLGYFEYFQFCEDIGAAPLPVLAAGVPCQNSSTGGAGQQGGILMEQMDEYIQDVLDLIEWANAAPTTKWGKLRAAAGHQKPFNLKYIGIGNEDLITDVFEERFNMIYKAIREKHPEIIVIGTVGPFYKGADYDEGWDIATKLDVPMVDEHYYETPGWFIHNQDFYDRYDRNKSKVYLGEYASRGNTWFNALAEAIYMTGLERNGDIVYMTSYAPLLAKEGRTQWNPDLIYFNNTEVKPTVNYEIQKLFGTYTGDQYVESKLVLSNSLDPVKARIAHSIIYDSVNKEMIIKIVNLLPVTVNISFDAGERISSNTTATKMIIEGNPLEKKVRTTQSQQVISSRFDEQVKPYSVTLIKMKAKIN